MQNLIKIANDLISEMLFTKGHIICSKGYNESITVKFKAYTSEANFRNIKSFLKSCNYFDKVTYTYSEALNGKGYVYAVRKTEDTTFKQLESIQM